MPTFWQVFVPTAFRGLCHEASLREHAPSKSIRSTSITLSRAYDFPDPGDLLVEYTDYYMRRWPLTVYLNVLNIMRKLKKKQQRYFLTQKGQVTNNRYLAFCDI